MKAWVRVFAAWVCGCWAAALAGQVSFLDTLDMEMMRPNGVVWRDLDLQAAAIENVPFRLSETEGVLQNPRGAQDMAGLWRSRLESARRQPLPVDSCLPALQTMGTSSWFMRVDSAASVKPLKPGQGEIGASLRNFAQALSRQDWDFVRQTSADLFILRPEDTLLDAVSMEKQRLSEAARSERLFRLAERLPGGELIRGARGLQALESRLLDSLRLLSLPKGLAAARRLVRQSGLAWHEGSSAAESHRVRDGVWVDVGGNDHWEILGQGKPGQALLIIDLGGNDVYHSADSLPSLTSFGGLLALADLTGDDRYQDAGFGFAAGLFGFSSLIDFAGDDVYEGGIVTQGFGFFGLGVLQDLAGRDSYSADLYAQASASTLGAGVLVDASGNDAYAMRPVYVDDLRYRDHFLSMGQGFATGFMLGEAGGVGVLWDAGGHDTYAADIFAQGSGYWHALGLLLDEGGSDRYVAHQYAQGAGVHEAIGVLVDASGDDRYYSKGVSQGCGHDRGLGLLADLDGGDQYVATDMSQGAGSANGVGLLVDFAGDDAYQGLKPKMTLGHGDMRRDRGSFGFFFDAAGQDVYPQGRSNASAWKVFGVDGRGNGFGRDR